MLRESCNTSTDIILRKIGGPKAVTEYLTSIGIKDMHNDRSCLEVIAATDGVTNLPANLECTLQQYKSLCAAVSDDDLIAAKQIFRTDIRDSATPQAMTDLLIKIFNNEILRPETITWLLSTMRRNKLYPNRLMGLLPPKTPVAHKTGTATGYTNDVGIVTLPDQYGHIAITAFIKNSSKDKISNERVLAEVGRTIYDYFLLCS
jgi:beta-lactamase class A